MWKQLTINNFKCFKHTLYSLPLVESISAIISSVLIRLPLGRVIMPNCENQNGAVISPNKRIVKYKQFMFMSYEFIKIVQIV